MNRGSIRRIGAAITLAAALSGAPIGATPTAPSDKPIGHLAHRAWRVDNGLPQDTVLALAETPDRYLWVGTRSGLARFDGVELVPFSRADNLALGTSIVTELLGDHRGTLWIGTDGGGLSSHLSGRSDIASVDLGAASPGVAALLETSDGALWVATPDGVLRSEGASEPRRWSPVEGLPQGVSSLAELDDGLLVGGRFGVVLWADGAVRWALDAADGLPSDRVLALEPDPATPGAWVATDRGLARVDPSGRVDRVVVETLRERRVVALQRSRRGALWIGTDGGGVHRLRADGTVEHWPDDHPAARHRVRSLLEDSRGNLWIGTASDGLHLLRDAPFVTYGVHDGLRSKIVTAVIPSRDGGVWLATRDAGIHRLASDGSLRAYGAESGFAVLGAWSMLEDATGLWVGTDGDGLYRFDGERATPVRRSEGLNRRVFAVEADGDGGLWIGTNGGVAHLPSPVEATVDGPVHVVEGLPGRQVRALHRTDDGRLWVGTVDGVAVIAGDPVEGYRVDCPLADATPPLDNVHSIHQARDGAIWIGSEGQGLARFDGARVDRLDTRRGLFSDQIVTVLDDAAGHLWLGSSQGVARIARADVVAFVRDPSQVPPQLVFGRADGLGGGGVWGSDQGGTLGTDGRLYFGTREGLAVLDPTTVTVEPAPEARIENVEIEVDGERVVVDEIGSAGIELADARTLRIRFSAPAPGRCGPRDLRFRLVGFDSDWSRAAKRHEKLYTHLPSGHYVFEVQASDAAGRFRGPTARLAIRVRPGLFQSPAFYGLALVALGLLALGLHRWRVGQLQRRRELASRRVEQAMDDLQVLRGLIPICGSCRKIRDDDGFWQQLELFLDTHSEARFTHGLCPDCAEDYLREMDEDSAIVARPL